MRDVLTHRKELLLLLTRFRFLFGLTPSLGSSGSGSLSSLSSLPMPLRTMGGVGGRWPVSLLSLAMSTS